MNKTSVVLTAALLGLGSTPLMTSWVPLSFIAPTPEITFAGNHAFIHQTGAKDPIGWGAYFRHHRPGYLVRGLKNGGEKLREGNYRYEFSFARRVGHFSSVLSQANNVIRLEVYDATSREILTERTFSLSDFSAPHKTALRKTLAFTTIGRDGHLIEPRVYWTGMAGIALQKVTRAALETPSLFALADKTELFAQQMQSDFLDRGYVIVRKADGSIADQGDAAIWTGIYAASLAMRYKTTQNPEALRHLETSLWALHRLYSAAPLPGTLVRYVEAEETPLKQAASKDTYTGFFYGVAQGLPYVKDAKLRDVLRNDLKNLADHFLAHDLSFQSAYGHPLSLNSSLTQAMMMEAMDDLQNKPSLRRKWAGILLIVRGYFWMHGQKPPAGFKRAVFLLKKNDMKGLERESIGILNDVRAGLKKLQKNIHRSALRGSREGLTDTPYMKLDLILLRVLNNFDISTEGRPFAALGDIKIFPSQSIHALHFIKVAAEAFPKPNPYDTYYRANLYEGKALLRTAIQWYQIDEDLLGAVSGETESNTLRTSSSHLGYVALHDLILLEKDPVLRFKYQKLFEARYRPMRTDGNAMIDAMHAAVGLSTRQLGLAWWSLGRYPVDRRGKGAEFWQQHKEELVAAFGGLSHRQARDPLPPDLRPRDAFIWQRSARSIYGDEKDWRYPPLDYLFAYWLARSAANVEAVREKS